FDQGLRHRRAIYFDQSPGPPAEAVRQARHQILASSCLPPEQDVPAQNHSHNEGVNDPLHLARPKLQPNDAGAFLSGQICGLYPYEEWVSRNRRSILLLPADVTEHIRMNVQSDIGQIVKMFAGDEPDDLADLAFGIMV